MFVAGTTCPKIGEIRYGYVSGETKTHKYKGVRPYLVVSNNVYNEHSGQSEVIPFTTKRIGSNNPAHVDYKKGEVNGLQKDSTLIVEGRDTLRNDQLSDPVGYFSDENWVKAVKAMMEQCPVLKKAFVLMSNS